MQKLFLVHKKRWWVVSGPTTKMVELTMPALLSHWTMWKSTPFLRSIPGTNHCPENGRERRLQGVRAEMASQGAAGLKPKRGVWARLTWERKSKDPVSGQALALSLVFPPGSPSTSQNWRSEKMPLGGGGAEELFWNTPRAFCSLLQRSARKENYFTRA